jgi:hypothetical protein
VPQQSVGAGCKGGLRRSVFDFNPPAWRAATATRCAAAYVRARRCALRVFGTVQSVCFTRWNLHGRLVGVAITTRTPELNREYSNALQAQEIERAVSAPRPRPCTDARCAGPGLESAAWRDLSRTLAAIRPSPVVCADAARNLCQAGTAGLSCSSQMERISRGALGTGSRRSRQYQGLDTQSAAARAVCVWMRARRS